MKAYEVIGKLVQIGQGVRLVINPDQLAARKHACKVLSKHGKDGHLVEALQVLHFKIGEVIGLAEPPAYVAEFLRDVRGPEGQTAAEQHRSGKAASRGAEAQRARFVKKATGDYEASAELKQKFATVEAYIASLEAAPKAA